MPNKNLMKVPSQKLSRENAFPVSLKIGPFTYEIRQSTNFAARHSMWGQARPAELVIEIEPDIDIGQKYQVLLHEAIHAADEHFHLGLPDEDKENAEDRLATILYGILKENNLLKGA